MEKSNKMNKRKKRLLVALIMLVITGIALTTATYAWFSANRVVTTTGIDVKVTAATGISISANALDFGKTIDMSDVISFAKERGENSTLQLPEELNPVSTSGITGSNTEFIFSRGELGDVEDVVYLQDSVTSKAFTKDSEGNPTNYTGGDYIAFDIYIKASQALTLKMANTTAITAYDGENTGNLESGLRIGFLPLGTSTDTSIDKQQSSAVALNKVQSDWKIWNPYPETHHAATLKGYETTGSEKLNGYYGANGTTKDIDALNSKGEEATQEDIDANSNHYVKFLYKDVKSLSETPGYLTLIDNDFANYMTGIGESAPSSVFSVGAGITKVRVYIWLEGNDVDCVDAISISNGLKINLGFEIA